MFRVVTRSHPWGYKRSNPDETLTVKTIRDALECFRAASSEIKDYPPHKIPLTHVWPVDAIAPIPLVFLIEALAEGGDNEKVTTHVKQRLEALPFWECEKDCWQKVKKGLNQAFSVENVELQQRWIDLVRRLRDTATLTANYDVSGLILPQTARPEAGLVTSDPLETLFIRVNRAGTTLEGEELMYSILKSSWIQAPQFIETLAAKLAHPPRLVRASV